MAGFLDTVGDIATGVVGGPLAVVGKKLLDGSMSNPLETANGQQRTGQTGYAGDPGAYEYGAGMNRSQTDAEVNQQIRANLDSGMPLGEAMAAARRGQVQTDAGADVDRFRGMGNNAIDSANSFVNAPVNTGFDRAAADLAGHQANQAAARQGQVSAIDALRGSTDMYRNAALGNGPSVAQSQFDRNSARARDAYSDAMTAGTGQALSLAASARGANARALATRQAAQTAGANAAQLALQTGRMTRDAATESSMLRAKEMQDAMAGYQQGAGMGTQAAGNLRASDIGMYGQRAGAAAQDSAAENQQRGQNLDFANRALDRGVQYNQMGQDVKKTALGASVQRDTNIGGWKVQDDATRAGIANNDRNAALGEKQAALKLTGDTLQAAGSLIGGAKGSDERIKRDIKSDDKHALSILSGLGAHSFAYKPHEGSEGRHLGVMAQELEKSPEGRTLVAKDERGIRYVDTGSAALMALAGVGALTRKLEKQAK